MGVSLGESARRVHLVHKQRHGACAELFDKEMAEKVVILGKVAHVHDLSGPPGPGCPSGGRNTSPTSHLGREKEIYREMREMRGEGAERGEEEQYITRMRPTGRCGPQQKTRVTPVLCVCDRG